MHAWILIFFVTGHPLPGVLTGFANRGACQDAKNFTMKDEHDVYKGICVKVPVSSLVTIDESPLLQQVVRRETDIERGRESRAKVVAPSAPARIGIVPNSYVPPPEIYPGQFIPKVAVEDACAVERGFAGREAAIFAAGASPSSEIDRVSPSYSQNAYALAHFEVIVSIIEFVSKHPGITPAQAETAAYADCFVRAKNPRYYANLMPPRN